VFHNSYYIDSGTVIYNGVTIIGPVYIGRNVELMPGALIRPYTIIGDGCSVGHGSEVKHTVMFGGAKIASLAFAGDSVLGASARLGSGVITANRKFDQSEVTAKIAGETVSLGADKFGLILGDSSRVGANCVTQPGTHIGPNTWVFPGVAARGFIPENTRVAEERTIRLSPNEPVELKP
jgi:bifunctional UDP-N-acetylglucosamine pyrophosphorylase/glucosamine-1-phosphate N-acetyltransferase